MKKLIRDKLGWTPKEGETVRLTRDWEEYQLLARLKLDEEIDEFKHELDRQSPLGITTEAADVIEALAHLVEIYTGTPLEDIVERARTRRAQHGGFEAGVVLEGRDK